MDIQGLKARLRLPVIAAPMFLISGVDLLLACCKAGIVGSMPAANARTSSELEKMLRDIRDSLVQHENVTGNRTAPWALNVVIIDEKGARFAEDLQLIRRYQPPIVITSFGHPGSIAEIVHGYGGVVFHDVANMRHAEKAIAAGVDGLILLTAGAGGHTGTASPFAFVPAIRKVWEGAVLLSGSISDGGGILAAEALGADFAYMGTRFSATLEALTQEDYRTLLQSQKMADVLTTDRLSGVLATFMRGSIARVGMDPDNLPSLKAPRSPDLPDHLRPWRDIWSAGHGVELIDEILPTAELVERLAAEYRASRARLLGD